MKLSAIVSLSFFALATALAPNSGRRAFLSKVATSAATVTVASPALAADQYALDFDESIVAKKETPKKSNDGGLIVGGALAAGFALSLPFFAPNLARMAGIKNAKMPPK